jgi:hypothetical protein
MPEEKPDRSIIELVSEVSEFNELSKFMNDPDLDLVLGYVVKLIAKPDIEPGKVNRLIVQLQAISAKFGMLKRYAMSLGDMQDKDEKKKKDIYFTAQEVVDDLVNALKYYNK